MFTINYKGWYIGGYSDDRAVYKVILPDGGLWCTCKTLQGAKRSITKALEWVNFKEVQ